MSSVTDVFTNNFIVIRRLCDYVSADLYILLEVGYDSVTCVVSSIA